MSGFIFDQRLAHGMPDFSNFTIDQIMPSAEEALKRARKRLESIINNPDIPSFENTIFALNHHSDELDYIGEIHAFTKRAEMTDALDKVSEQFEALSSDYSTEIATNAALFERIKFLKENADNLMLDAQQRAALDRKFHDFSENGALLSDEDKTTLKDINARLALARKTYLKNMSDAEKNYVRIEDEADLNGYPETFKKNAALKAAELQLNVPFAISMDTPTYLVAMKNCTNRDLRRQLFETRNQMTQSGDTDNRPVALEILQLRDARAKLLGADNHAAYILPTRMVNTVDKAFDFIGKLVTASSEAESKELGALETLGRKLDGIETLEPWDVQYYMNQSKKSAGVDEEKLREYFEVNHALDSTLSHLERLFGLTFTRSDAYSTMHDDVQIYEMRTDAEQETPTAIFYFDLYKRAGKKTGAWEAAIQSRTLKEDGSTQIPIVTINTNYVKAPDGEPTYISLNDFVTLNHEMGHGLHEGLTITEHADIASGRVAWDFVELPSMALEKFAEEPEILRVSTRHKETGQPMPDELIQEIKARGEEFPGIFLKRQAQFALFDMTAYTTDPETIASITELEEKVRDSIGGVAYEHAFSHHFHHMFSGGYAAGYYSYFWSDALALDAFDKLTKNGTYDREVADSFRHHILAKGASEPADQLYRAFSGTDPDVNALFRNLKLPEIEQTKDAGTSKPAEPTLEL